MQGSKAAREARGEARAGSLRAGGQVAGFNGELPNRQLKLTLLGKWLWLPRGDYHRLPECGKRLDGFGQSRGAAQGSVGAMVRLVAHLAGNGCCACRACPDRWYQGLLTAFP